MEEFDYLIIGCGLAGLSLALKVAENNTFKVALISKSYLFNSNTSKAQGGIACVIDKKNDSFISHIQDTILAGAGLCDENMVTQLVNEAPYCINELIKYGVRFTKKSSQLFDLGLEGGHSYRRILHCEDITGDIIEKTLLRTLKKYNNIIVYEYCFAIDLLLDNSNICRGAYFFNSLKKCCEMFIAKITVLACGGIGGIYSHTSNTNIATGDGIAMAYRAGATISNMEFIQFHPTCLYTTKDAFLISEAIRGEGGVLRLHNGKTFMHKYHKMNDLAPRDIVSRSIYLELRRNHIEFIYLDITKQKKEFIVNRFPNIYKKCLQYGIDITKDFIPVTPAAHFICGGILINHNGRTTIKNLYAIGETACSGIHGANRLASNSLLECIVYSHRISKDSLQFIQKTYQKNNILLPEQNYTVIDKNIKYHKLLLRIKKFTWNNLGICRNMKQLLHSYNQIYTWKKEIKKYLSIYNAVPQNIIEIKNMINIIELITKCSIQRHESRGSYFNIDYPYTKTKFQYNSMINIAEEGT
ncbi:MAG: L-aspartate oxidase [Endomicrobium sp.]|nr:L-aspartate oxidase [Endomicrobium sp.]